MALAKIDFRDVLAKAEYPEELRHGFIGMKDLPKEEIDAIRKRNRAQYLDWLKNG